MLFDVGDESYPFIAIIEGEVEVQDARRHGGSSATAQSGFLGEMNLLTGQTVFLRAVVTEPMRYIAVDRADLRPLLTEDGSLADLLLSTFITRRENLAAPRRASASRSSAPAPRRRPAGSSSGRPGPGCRTTGATPSTPRTPRPRRSSQTLEPGQLPLVRLPGGAELHNPTNGEISRALGIGLELGEQRGGRPADRRRRAGRPRRRGLRRLGGARDAGPREHGARRPGRHLAADRELPRLPGRDQRLGADQPRRHPGPQVRQPDRDPVQARLAGARRRPPRRPPGGRQRGLGPRRRPGHRRRVPPAPGRGPRGLRGRSASSTPPGRPRPSAAAPRASPWSAAATRPPRPRSGWRGAGRS